MSTSNQDTSIRAVTSALRAVACAPASDAATKALHALQALRDASKYTSPDQRNEFVIRNEALYYRPGSVTAVLVTRKGDGKMLTTTHSGREILHRRRFYVVGGYLRERPDSAVAAANSAARTIVNAVVPEDAATKTVREFALSVLKHGRYATRKEVEAYTHAESRLLAAHHSRANAQRAQLATAIEQEFKNGNTLAPVAVLQELEALRARVAELTKGRDAAEHTDNPV